MDPTAASVVSESAIEIDGISYPIVFNTNAATKLEMYLYKNQLGTVGELLARLTAGNAGIVEAHLLFWALLEGGRIKNGWRAHPVTVEEAGVFLDKLGGLAAVVVLKAAILEAVKVAQPEPTKGDDPKNVDARKPTRGKRSSLKRSK